MFRKGLFAIAMLVLCFTFVAAETIKGKIAKIDDKSVTVTTKTDKDGKAYDLADKCKFFKENKDSKDGKDEIKDGTKADVFAKIGKKGINATITTNDSGKVTEVLLTAGKKAAN